MYLTIGIRKINFNTFKTFLIKNLLLLHPSHVLCLASLSHMHSISQSLKQDGFLGKRQNIKEKRAELISQKSKCFQMAEI